MEHIVLRLLHGGRDKSKLARNFVGLGDFSRAPFGRAPIKHLTLRDEIAHRAHRFLDRRVRIRPVAEIKVEIIDTQPPQRRVTRLDHVFAAKPLLIREITAPENLA